MSERRKLLTPIQKRSVSRIAALTVVNAMVFQEVLAAHDARVNTLRKTLEAQDPVSAFAGHWQFILREINYFPIFNVAREVLLTLTAGPDVESAFRQLADRALAIVNKRAALRHDLVGRVYHRLLAEKIAKHLGTYYTSVPAATLLLKLALDRSKWGNVDWTDLAALPEQFKVADLACGTGTLLMAAAEAIADNHVRSSAESGVSPDLSGLHRALVEGVLHGYDVLPSALHLTASTLAMRAPEITFQQMRLYCLPLGGPHHRLGSIEFLVDSEVPITVDLFGPTAAVAMVTGKGDLAQRAAPLPKLDLLVMNPPFTRSVGHNLLFGSVPEGERKAMQRKLAALLRVPRSGADSAAVMASSTAGLGSVFVAVGDKHLKPGGRMALVLPKGLLSGVAWGKTRELFKHAYNLECLVVSHEPDHWNFSENTDLSEVLVVARKHNADGADNTPQDVTCVNLWRNPNTVFEALGVAYAIDASQAPDVELGQGASELTIGDTKFGEAVSVPWSSLRQNLWMPPCAFAQSELVRAVHHLIQGRLYLPGQPVSRALRLCALGDLGKLGPDRRDIHDGFRLSKAETAFPAFWGHDASAMRTLAQSPNAYLSPLARAKKGRPLRKANVLWPLAGDVLLAERLWLKTQRVTAVHVDRAVLSNVWWPFAGHADDAELDKGLVLWLNSTLGLLLLFAHREETRGAWVDFKKPVLKDIPVLDFRALSARQRGVLAEAYHRFSAEPLLPFPQMNVDPVRAAIDDAVSKALRLPNITVLRELLAREPVVCLRPLE